MKRYVQLIALCIFSFTTTTIAAEQRLFMVTGELSGEKLGSWYLQQHASRHPHDTIRTHAVGGDSLRAAGATIIKPYSDLSLGFVGISAFFSHLWHLWNIYTELRSHAKTFNPTHIVLVDCPLLNFPLARRLKKDFPAAHLTYVAPPEMWIWGTWGMHRWLRRYCDEVVVLYPFEKTFYAQHNLSTTYYGWPRFAEFSAYTDHNDTWTDTVAILPGSRRSEVKRMAPIFTKVMKLLYTAYPQLHFIWIVPNYLADERLHATLQTSGVPAQQYHLHTESATRYDALASCCFALSKPGTITLELGMLGVPTIVCYTVPWLTGKVYQWLLQVPHVSLPNLLLGKEVYPELLQDECTPANITNKAGALYLFSQQDSCAYAAQRRNIRSELHRLLGTFTTSF